MMIHLPTNAQVQCSDGHAGRSTHLIGDPNTHRVTHLVVRSDRPPFQQIVVPIDEVETTTPTTIQLKCSRGELNSMASFEYEDRIPKPFANFENLSTADPTWPYTLPVPMRVPGTELEISVMRQNIPAGEVAVRRGARVEAADGYVGTLDEVLINSENMQVSHLVLLEGHPFRQREVTVPVSQIDWVEQNKITLKLDRQSVQDLPATAIDKWTN